MKKKTQNKKKYSCLETAIIKGKQLKAVAVFYSDVQMWDLSALCVWSGASDDTRGPPRIVVDMSGTQSCEKRADGFLICLFYRVDTLSLRWSLKKNPSDNVCENNRRCVWAYLGQTVEHRGSDINKIQKIKIFQFKCFSGLWAKHKVATMTTGHEPISFFDSVRDLKCLWPESISSIAMDWTGFIAI